MLFSYKVPFLLFPCGFFSLLIPTAYFTPFFTHFSPLTVPLFTWVFTHYVPPTTHLVKARPAFHYRLPDCKVNEAGWTAAAPWNRWVFIEVLAEDRALLAELIDAWREHSRKVTLARDSRWVIALTSLLSQKFFAR